MRAFTLLGVALFGIVSTLALRGEAAEAPRASVDLTTTDGTGVVDATWRYADVQLVPTRHRGPDANGQPTGNFQPTWDYEPHAGVRDFDDRRLERRQPRDPRTQCEARTNHSCRHLRSQRAAVGSADELHLDAPRASA